MYLLTIIIPAYNEQATIGELLRRVSEAPYHKQIIVVDDASTDATPDILACSDCQVIRHPTNRGKGAAIRTGLAHAVGEFTIVQDADLEYDPEDYPKLIEPLMLGADAVYGSRYLERNRTGAWTNRVGVSVLNLAVRLLYTARLTDEATCYKAIPTVVLRAMDLRCERFEFCPEVTAKALRMGLRITEVPIRYHARSVAQGKKIRLRDGVEALRTLWWWRNWRPGYSPDGQSNPPASRHCQSSSKLTTP